MGWLARGVAVVGIGGAVTLGTGAAAFAAPAHQDPLGTVTKQLPVQLPSLPGLDHSELSQLSKQLQDGAKQLPIQLPSSLPTLDLSGLTPKSPLICGIGIGIGGPINGSCPHSGQKVITKHGPREVKTVVVKQTEPSKPGPTKVVEVPVVYKQVASAPTGKLAYTGFATLPVLSAGLAALIGGVVLTAVARPRRATTN